jgi:F-type H+-transporting ATPase subunit b
VLGQEVLRLRRRQLRGVDLLADRLLALVHDLEERAPGELAEDPGEEREKAIREQVDSAQLAAAEAKDLLAQHQEMLRGAGREREEILQKAIREADGVRADLVGKARGEAEQATLRAREQIGREKDQALAELRAQVADIAVEAASRIVKSSLTEEAQRKLVDDYIKELPAARRDARA